MAMKKCGEGEGGGGKPLPPIPYTLDHTKQTNIFNGALQLQL